MTRHSTAVVFALVVLVGALGFGAASPEFAVAKRSQTAEALREWQPDVNAARKYAQGRSGSNGFAVRDVRNRLWQWQGGRKVPMASTFKVMIMAAYLRQPGVNGRGLADWEKNLIRPMIRSSDDDAANNLVGRLGAGPINNLAKAAGMKSFSYDSSIWGMSQTTAIDQVQFMKKLETLVPKRHRGFALAEMASIVPGQRWGIGAVKLPKGWKRHFKGGWGSGSGAVDHQVALLRRGKFRISLTITTTGNPSHAYAKETLRGIAHRLLKDLDVSGDSYEGVTR